MLSQQQIELLVSILLDGYQKVFQEKLVLITLLEHSQFSNWRSNFETQMNAGSGQQEAALAMERLRKVVLTTVREGTDIPQDLLKPPTIH